MNRYKLIFIHGQILTVKQRKNDIHPWTNLDLWRSKLVMENKPSSDLETTRLYYIYI
jgi:hypothetical protein